MSQLKIIRLKKEFVMIVHKSFLISRPTSNDIADYKMEKGFLGMEDDDGEITSATDKHHIGQWWRRWLRIA